MKERERERDSVCVCVCVCVSEIERESGAYLICGMDGGSQEAYPFTASIKLNIRRMRNSPSKDTQEHSQILGETFFGIWEFKLNLKFS